MVTMASPISLSTPILATRPIVTPAETDLGSHPQTRNVVEFRFQDVGARRTADPHAADAKRQKYQAQDPCQHKSADTDLDRAHSNHLNSPYITSVRMKSKASTATDEYTTVLVVATLMPSAVGVESYP